MPDLVFSFLLSYSAITDCYKQFLLFLFHGKYDQANAFMQVNRKVFIEAYKLT